MKTIKLKFVAVLAMLASTAALAGSDLTNVNPQKGEQIDPMSYQTLGSTLENKANGDQLALVCLEMSASGICKGYRYVEIPSLMNSQWTVLGKSNFTFRKIVDTNPNKKITWMTVEFTKSFNNCYNNVNCGLNYATFVTTFGMIFGIGELSWAGAIAVDGVHAVLGTPFEALANAIRKDATRRNNSLLVDMGRSGEIGKNVRLRSKRYDRIRSAIDEQL